MNLYRKAPEGNEKKSTLEGVEVILITFQRDDIQICLITIGDNNRNYSSGEITHNDLRERVITLFQSVKESDTFEGLTSSLREILS